MNSPNSAVASQLSQQYLISPIAPRPIHLVRGQGCRVWDNQGREYLDFFPGGGCNILGHCHPALVEAVSQQASQIMLSSPHWASELSARWAQMLVERSFEGRVHFCNSGAEATEAAIRLARLHQGPQRYKIIAFQNASHGLTLGALAASGHPESQVGPGPMAAGFSHIALGDLNQLESQIDEATAAILIEPVQVSAGIQILPTSYIEELKKICDQYGLLLIFDESQTGMGRTGHWFAYQHSQVQPDIMILAKGLCGGVAAGAVIARRELTEALDFQLFQSTFGGNPIACSAGIKVMEVIENGGLLDEVQMRANLFAKLLDNLKEQSAYVRHIRQLGLMIGIELIVDAATVASQCADNGLLVHYCQGDVLRMAPALNVTIEEIEKATKILTDSISQTTEQVVAGEPNTA